MNKILSKIKNASLKSKFLVGILGLAIAVPGAILAWGPDRPTYTMENPADHVTFNSITNAQGNFFSGDERNFVLIREEGGNWVDQVDLQPGKTYEVFNYFHNNASTTLNSAEYNYAGIAKNAKMDVNIPATVQPGEKAQFLASVSADNASPNEVWDQAYGTNTTSGVLGIRIVSGSATIHSNGAVNGTKMPDELFTTGANLGYDSLNGEIPGCLPYSGYVSYKVKIVQPNFEVSKKVSKSGANDWQESISAKPGETVDYLIEYKNTGSTDQNDVVLKDTLPEGMTYVEGSSSIANASNNFTPTKISDGITSGGYIIGNYTPGSNAYVKFSAKMPSSEQLPCGDSKLTNKATASTANGSKDDTADVTTNKECKPSYSCDALTITKISRTKFEFNTNYTINNTEFTGVKYVVKDSNGKTVTDKTVSNGTKLTYENSNAGKYTVESTVITKDGNATSQKCKGSIEVAKEDKPGVSIQKTVNSQEKISIAANTDFTYELVVRNTGNVDLKDVVVSDDAPENVKFISADKGTIKDNKFSYTISTLKVGASETIKITAQATKTGISEKNTACLDTPTVPGAPDDCDDADIVVPTPEEPVTPPVTPEEPTIPTTPSELPQTGPAEMISAVLGIGSVTAALGYYIASRKQF